MFFSNKVVFSGIFPIWKKEISRNSHNENINITPTPILYPLSKEQMFTFEDLVAEHIRNFFDEPFNGQGYNTLQAGDSSNSASASGSSAKRCNNGVCTFGGRRGLNLTMELNEGEKEYNVVAELSGIPKENIKVSIDKNVLTIEGERTEVVEKNKAKYHFSERRYGKFSRSLLLPEDANVDDVKSKYQNGELTLTFAKNVEAAKKKEIKIQ
jgi:HSP20 family molecular chaperone IbpA